MKKEKGKFLFRERGVWILLSVPLRLATMKGKELHGGPTYGKSKHLKMNSFPFDDMSQKFTSLGGGPIIRLIELVFLSFPNARLTLGLSIGLRY